MRSFKDFICEGLHDPARHKAIFLLGGPGSGKSYIRDRTKGDLGFKSVDSDAAFEHAMKKHGLSLKMPEHEKEARDAIRTKAKETTAKRAAHWRNGRLGMMIDGTGRDHEQIIKHSQHLRDLGYDTHAIFVNTSLHVAHHRNESRPRSVPRETVEHSWHAAQNNLGKFQQHFGSDKMHIVDNNHPDENVIHRIHKKVRKIATAPVTNPIAKQWEKEQIAKRTRS